MIDELTQGETGEAFDAGIKAYMKVINKYAKKRGLDLAYMRYCLLATVEVLDINMDETLHSYQNVAYDMKYQEEYDDESSS